MYKLTRFEHSIIVKELYNSSSSSHPKPPNNILPNKMNQEYVKLKAIEYTSLCCAAAAAKQKYQAYVFLLPSGQTILTVTEQSATAA